MKTLQMGLFVLTGLCVALTGEALTVHRSFRTRDIGFGGGIGSSVPIDARVDKAICEGRAKEADRPRTLVGRVTGIVDGRTLKLVTDGGTLVTVRLKGVAIPRDDAARARVQKAKLKMFALGRNVRVEFRSSDQTEDGLVVGRVTCGKRDVNEQVMTSRDP